MKANCDFWESHCHVLCREYIDSFINKYSMQQLIALTYCVIDTEKSLHSDDSTIKFIHNLVKQ